MPKMASLRCGERLTCRTRGETWTNPLLLCGLFSLYVRKTLTNRPCNQACIDSCVMVCCGTRNSRFRQWLFDPSAGGDSQTTPKTCVRVCSRMCVGQHGDDT